MTPPNTYNDIYGNILFPAAPTYNSILLNQSTTPSAQLYWWTQYGVTINAGSQILASTMDVSTTLTTNPILQLPDATLGSTGTKFSINNRGGETFQLTAFDGSVKGEIASSVYAVLYLVSNAAPTPPAMQDTNWILVILEGAAGGITSIGIDTSATNDNITVTPSTITSNDTFEFGLGRDLGSLSSFGAGVGFAAHTSQYTWALRVLGTAPGTSDIRITNADGSAGAPLFSLNPNLGVQNNLFSLQLASGANLLNISALSGGNNEYPILSSTNGSLQPRPLICGTNYLFVFTPTSGAIPVPVTPRGGIIFPHNGIGGTDTGFSSFVIPAGMPLNYSFLYNLPIVGPSPNQSLVAGAVTSSGNNYIVPLQWANNAIIPGGAGDNTIAIYIGDQLSTSNVFIESGGVSAPAINNISNIGSLQLTSISTQTLTIGAAGDTSFFNTIDAQGAPLYLRAGTDGVLIPSSTSFGWVANDGMTTTSIVGPGTLNSSYALALPQTLPGSPTAYNQIMVLNTAPIGTTYRFAWTNDPTFLSLSTANFAIDTTANTISSPTGAIHLVPITGQYTHLHTGGIVHIGMPMQFYNQADTFYSSIQGHPLTSQNIVHVLPENPPNLNAILACSGTGPSNQWNWTLTPALNSVTTTNMDIDGVNANSITATGGDNNIHLRPNTGGAVYSHGTFILPADGQIQFNNTSNSNYFTLQAAPLLGANSQYVWPANPVQNGILTITNTSSPWMLGWSTTVTVSSFSTANLQYEVVAPYTISNRAVNGGIILLPNGMGNITLGSNSGTGITNVLNGLNLNYGAPITFTSPTDGFTTSFQQPNGATSNITFNLPITVPTTPGVLTVTGSASPYTLSVLTNPTLTSLATSHLGIETLASNTISSTNTNGAITLSANGSGNVILGNASGTGITQILRGATFLAAASAVFNNTANSNSISIAAPGSLAASVSYLLPVAPTAINQVLVNTSSSTPWQMGWSSTLALTSFTTTNMSFDVTANSILATNPNGNVLVAGNGTGKVILGQGSTGVTQVNNGLTVLGGAAFNLNNTANTFTTSLSANPAQAANISYYCPTTAPTQNQVMVITNSSSPWQKGWTSSLILTNLTTTNMSFDVTANSILATGTNANILIAGNGTGKVILGQGSTGVTQVNNGLTVLGGASFNLNNTANAFSTSISANPAQAANISYYCPTSAPTQNQVMVITNSSSPWQKGWTSSLILTNLTTTNMTFDVTANTITATNTNGSINLTPNGTGTVNSNAQLNVANNQAIQLSGNSHAITIQPSASTTTAYTVTLPLQGATEAGQVLRCTSTGATNTPSIIFCDSMNENILMNGCMRWWQRNTSFTSSTTFFPNNTNVNTADLWKLQSQVNNTVTVARSTFVPTDYNAVAFSWQATSTATGVGNRFGLVQIRPAMVSKAIVNRYLSFSLEAASSAFANIRMAIIGWTGTSDAPTTPVVSSWGAAGTNPTLATNWSYQSTPVNMALTTTYQWFTLPNILCSTSGINNLAVFVWVDDVIAASGVTFNVTSLKLEPSQICTPFSVPEPAAELASCLIFFEKDFPIATAVGTPTTWSAKGVISRATYGTLGGGIANNSSVNTFQFSREKYLNPTVVTYPYTTVTNTGRLSIDTGADQAANSASLTPPSGIAASPSVDTTGFVIWNTSGGTITSTAGDMLCHWYADCSF